MLKINPEINPTFKETIDITIPCQKETGKLTLNFKYRTRDEFIDFSDEMIGKEDADVVMEMAEGWENIDGEFTREEIDTFLNNYPAAAAEIFNQYRQLLFESRIKN